MKLSKPLLTIFLALFLPSIIYGEESSEEAHTYNLEEISIEAPKVVRKVDMDVYHPSQSSVQQSSNGLQLLTRLAIPALSIDDVMGKITAAGSDVQLRINGRVVTVEQVRNLQPESIKRVEWIDNPGLRYNGADYVLNFIVTNPQLGGSLMVSALPMFNTLFGNYNVDLKLNNGKSQWNIGLFYKPCNINKVHRKYYESFTFPDGAHLTRNEIPVGGKVVNEQGWGNISYSYIKPDTTIFYAAITAWSDIHNLGRFYGELIQSNENESIDLLNETESRGITPALSLYLEQHFKRRQTLLLDFSASLFPGFSKSKYQESYPDEELPFTDIQTHIRDFNQAYGIEADYIKNWDNSKLTTGISYTANRNRSKYLNLNGEIFHQRQDKVYFFGEYFQRVGKFNFSAGLGAQYTDFLLTETRQGSHSWNLRPKATITFSPNSNNQIRLNFNSWQTSPSLSETNIAPQQIDNFQWNKGNPYLKTYNNYSLDLRYAFNFWRIAGNFNIGAKTSQKAIAPYLFWEDDKLFTSYENSKGKKSLSFSLAPQIDVVPEWLTISGNLQYLNERTRGKGYKLYNHNWNGSVNLILTHWNFTLMAQYNKAPRTLWGEKITWGEDMSTIVLAYKWNNWQFGAVVFMPFGKYDQGSKMISKWNTNEYHLRLDFRMVGLNINYNLQWGKQKRSVNKLIDADASVEKSSAKSR